MISEMLEDCLNLIKKILVESECIAHNFPIDNIIENGLTELKKTEYLYNNKSLDGPCRANKVLSMLCYKDIFHNKNFTFHIEERFGPWSDRYYIAVKEVENEDGT